MRRPLLVIACSVSVVSACGGSSSRDVTTTTSATSATAVTKDASLKPLPGKGCMLLSAAEVSRFLGKVPRCEQVRRISRDENVVGATWQTTLRDPSVKAGLSRVTAAADKETFEREAGTTSNAGAKVVRGLGDDAVLVRQPHDRTSGSIWILRGGDTMTVAVSRGVLSGDALATALTATGRRLLASYE